MLAVWDETAFIDSGLSGTPQTGAGFPAGACGAVVHTLRKWNAHWLKTLSAEQLQRQALHPERGEQSVRFMLTYITWHLEHHSWYLNRKVELLLSRR